MSLSFKFHEDPSFGCGDICKTIMTFVWRFCARSRQNVRAQVYASCGRVCARIFTKLFLFGLYYLMNLSFKFYKDPSFSYSDICKTMLTYDWSLIFYVFFFNLSIKVPPNCENYMKLVATYGNFISKCPGISEKMAQILAHMVLLNRSYSKMILYHSLWITL